MYFLSVWYALVHEIIVNIVQAVKLNNRSSHGSSRQGWCRRYLDTTPPEEYSPEIGEVNLNEVSLTRLADLYGSDKGTLKKHNYCLIYERLVEKIINATPRSQVTMTIGEIGVALRCFVKNVGKLFTKRKNNWI